MSFEIKPVAHIESDFESKFGIPRQPGLVDELEARIVFEPEFRDREAIRGIEGYSHIWLIWQFSENIRSDWSPTVRPPRLGGNTRVGVFASRSPFRPNSLGLSCVKLERIENDVKNGAVLVVKGADLMNGTPIFDIKPYLPYSDCVPAATEGFAPQPVAALEVHFSEGTENIIAGEKKEALVKLLSYDPRPHYQNDSERIYGFKFAGHEIKFRVSEGTLTILEITAE